MTREEFRQAVFERDNNKCVNCDASAVDAHHLIERRLWPDGGYHLDNGVSLCAECHILAEETILQPWVLRLMAGIETQLLPETLEDDHLYDKWGNIVLESGKRMRGPLFYDESVQKVLASGHALEDFEIYVKYPRTPHLPWSQGLSRDDMQLGEVLFKDEDIVVVTEKMDGENTTMYRDYVHSRSLDSGYHESRTWVKNFWAQNISYQIPANMRIVGENMYAVHSIKYDDLTSYFYGISMWEDDICLDWDTTLENFEILGIIPIPVMIYGEWGDIVDDLKGLRDGGREGYVVRTINSFRLQDFHRSVAKYVRKDHVTTSTHWKSQILDKNALA